MSDGDRLAHLGLEPSAGQTRPIPKDIAEFPSGPCAGRGASKTGGKPAEIPPAATSASARDRLERQAQISRAGLYLLLSMITAGWSSGDQFGAASARDDPIPHQAFDNAASPQCGHRESSASPRGRSSVARAPWRISMLRTNLLLHSGDPFCALGKLGGEGVTPGARTREPLALVTTRR